jgi:hypothetical protein
MPNRFTLITYYGHGRKPFGFCFPTSQVVSGNLFTFSVLFSQAGRYLARPKAATKRRDGVPLSGC